MKKLLNNTLLMMAALIFAFGLYSCDENPILEPDNDSLYIKFINDAQSDYTITALEVRDMGKAGANEPKVIGNWSGNILPAGTVLAPGGSTYFSLPIPNLHWSQYRLGVQLPNGQQLMLHEQIGAPVLDELPITHWGSHERTVSVNIQYDESSGFIYIGGWSDWAGIDD